MVQHHHVLSKNIYIYIHIDQWNDKEIAGFLILFGSLPQRTKSFSIIFRFDLASPGCLAGGTCTSKGRWWSQSTSLQSGGLAWASGITRRQGWRWVAKFWKNFAHLVCWKVDDQTWKFPRFTKVIVGYQGLKKHQLISVSYWLCPYLHVKKGIWKIGIFRGNGHVPFRPVLLSTFLGNWRLRLRRWNAAGPNHADVCIPSKVDLQFHTKFICKTHQKWCLHGGIWQGSFLNITFIFQGIGTPSW